MNIEFIIPTYNRTNHLKTIVCSLLTQNDPNWIAHIVGDNVENNVLEEIHNFLNYINDSRIRFTNLPERHNDWGHTPRNYGLDHAIGDWIVMTGEDNYYVPTFVKNFLNEARVKKTDFIFCSFIYNQAQLGDVYYPMKARLEYQSIDIGCYSFRKDKLNQVRLRTDIAEADYYFMTDYLTQEDDMTAAYIDEILYVHN